MNNFVALDLETTGLDHKYDRIIEIGAAKIIGGQVTETFSTFVNPGRRLEEHVTDITGITDKDVEGAPAISDVIQDLLDFTEGYDLLGHRILFDYSFVKHAAVNYGKTFERNGVDTLKISRACCMELPSKKLTDMCARYGIEYKAHRALNDALATVELYKCLERDFAEKRPDVFVPSKLICQVKKESPIRQSQIERINALIDRYHIECPYDISRMTRNEANRYYDKLCLTYKRK